MGFCKKLRVIPTNINLASLEEVEMWYCSQLASFPDISSNIKKLSVEATKIKDVPPSIVRCWSRLDCLEIGSRSLKRLTLGPQIIRKRDLINSDINTTWYRVIGLPHLVELTIDDCTNLVSTPALSPSLLSINVNECGTGHRECCSDHNPIKLLTLNNFLELDEEARKGIIQELIYEYICLPGRELPTDFTHKATGNSITTPNTNLPGGEGTFFASIIFEARFLLSPIMYCRFLTISCRLRSGVGDAINSICSSARLSDLSPRPEQLFIFFGDLFRQRNGCRKVGVSTGEILLEFRCWYNDDSNLIECGLQVLTEKAVSWSSREVENFETESGSSEVENSETESSSSEVDYYHTDGEYEVEAFKVSQVENI